MDNTEWLKMVAEVAAGAAEGLPVECSHPGCNVWYPKDITTGFLAGALYRIKPRTITVNGFEVPEPMRIKPDEGFEYFVSTPSDSEMFYVATWDDDIHDERWFYRGLCHTTEEAAIAHAKAMLGIDPNQPEE